MSVYGLLDAMRADRPLSERVVWQCLENHANGARFWPMTIEEIAAELHLNKGTVNAAILALERDAIIRADRHRRRKTVFHMLRTYAPDERKASKQPARATNAVQYQRGTRT